MGADDSMPLPTKRKSPRLAGDAADSDYFSLGNLNELCGIEDNISFAGSLLDEYEKQFSSSERQSESWSRFREALAEIRRRQDDEKLNLSIVGEFSAGKSTFINALLRQKLLVSSPIQGTTLASTIIEKGDEYSLIVSYLDRKRPVKETFDTVSPLRERLVELTTDESVAKRLKTVRVVLPTECFCPDVRIIDTPGTNAVEAWHEEVAVRTIKEQSDLSVVLVTADRLVTNTVLEFVKRHLGPILQQCVFVVTHIDKIETVAAREEILDYIRKRIKSELELESPIIIPYASTLVLNGGNKSSGDLSESEARDMIKMSQENESLLQRHMTRMRLVVQAKSLMLLITSLYREVSAQLNLLSQRQQKKLEVLNKAQKADFRSFVAEQKTKLLAELQSKIADIEYGVGEKIDGRMRSVKNSLLGQILSQQTNSELKKHLETEVKPKFSDQLSRITQCAQSAYVEMQNHLRTLLERFYSDLVEEYKHSGLVKLEVPVNSISYPVVARIGVEDMSGALNYVIEQNSKEDKITLGGGIAGAAVGTAICPGIGTVIGFFGGMFAAQPAVPNVTQVRQVCYDKLSAKLNTSLDVMKVRTVYATKEYGKSIGNLLEAEIDRYYESYKKAVDELVDKERRKIEKTSAILLKLRNDETAVSQRSGHLESISKKLDDLTRGPKS